MKPLQPGAAQVIGIAVEGARQAAQETTTDDPVSPVREKSRKYGPFKSQNEENMPGVRG